MVWTIKRTDTFLETFAQVRSDKRVIHELGKSYSYQSHLQFFCAAKYPKISIKSFLGKVLIPPLFSMVVFILGIANYFIFSLFHPDTMQERMLLVNNAPMPDPENENTIRKD